MLYLVPSMSYGMASGPSNSWNEEGHAVVCYESAVCKSFGRITNDESLACDLSRKALDWSSYLIDLTRLRSGIFSVNLEKIST